MEREQLKKEIRELAEKIKAGDAADAIRARDVYSADYGRADEVYTS